MLLKRTYLRALLLLIFLWINSATSFAADDPVQTFPLLGSKDSVKINYVSTVADYQNLLRLENPSMLPAIQSGTTHIVNTVSVGIEEDSKTYIETDFSATVVLHIKRYDQTLNLIDEFDSSFTINYLKAEGAQYTSLKYFVFENSYKTEVKIISIDPHGTTSWDVSKVLRIDNTLQATRDYVFNCAIDAGGLAVSFDNINGELSASWNDPSNGQTEYDLEWAWVANDADDAYKIGGAWNQDLLFSSNSTRITTSLTTYKIPLLYDGDGKIFVRVRPAQIRISGQRVEGHWNWQNGSSPVFYTFAGHEVNLNWQASTSYAEGGKRKSVVQYFDGTLRNRQTVTKDNTTGGPIPGANGTTIVAESFYDYQGRPVIQVLPAPTLNTIIAYSQNFNKGINFTGYPKWAYDKQDANASICGSIATPMDVASGASKYYSPSNGLVNNPASGYNPNKYIPDAEKYPFTETRFTPDGRMAAQGGVGIRHQQGSNHETKYLYEAPAQEELDALFGTDAGIASHYFKNIVKDANGQYSISFSDMHGRTVATALAGEAAPGTDPLPSLNQRFFTKELLDNETNRVIGKSIISSKSLAALNDGNYTFHYKLDPDQLQTLNCKTQAVPVCYDCLYNLKITITSDCNKTGFPYTVTDSNFRVNSLVGDPVCNNGKTPGTFNKTFTVWLPEGGYTVTKVLTLNDSARNYLRDIYVKKDTCKTFFDFYQFELTALNAQSNCAMTCVSCSTALGTLASFRAKFIAESGFNEPLSDSMVNALTASYNIAKANCDRLCNTIDNDGLEAVRAIKRVMLMDVTPPRGQYAKTDFASLGATYNIFNDFSPWANVFNSYKPAFFHPIIYNWNGAFPSLFNSDYINRLGNRVQPHYNAGFSNIPEFMNQWEPAWAEQLLPNHPEYAKLKAIMEVLPATYQFEANLNNLDTWVNMVNATTIPGQYISGLIEKDPFFKIANGIAPGQAYYNAMLLKVNQFVQMAPNAACPSIPTDLGPANLWQVAYASVFCRSNPDACATSQCFVDAPQQPANSPTTGCARDWDLVWKNFRSVYLSERRKFISEYLNSRPSAVKATILSASGYEPRFLDFGANGTGVPGGLNAGDLTTLFNQLGSGHPEQFNTNGTATTVLAAQYAATCQGYANVWISQLASCDALTARWQNPTVKASDIAWLMPRLTDICEKGSDPQHFLGSSSIDPTLPINTTYGNREFTEVIRNFLTNVAHITPPITAQCNPYLITIPKPYDKQPSLVNTAVMTKPSDCECTQITAMATQYSMANYPGTFSNYLENNYNTYISQGALDTLLSLCHGTYVCVFLPKVISLPPVLQCHPASGPSADSSCIKCDRYQQIKDGFLAEFLFAAPIANPQTQADIDKNMAFQNYANHKTGFTKRWIDYVNFGIACANVQTIPCASLDSVLQLFYLSTVYLQNPLGSQCRQAFVNFFNNAFGTFNSYAQWMNIFMQSCGHQPDPCGVRLTCSRLEQYIDSFYTVYGVQIHNNANCMQLFVNFINSNLHINFQYSQIEATYQYLCHTRCTLNVCSFPNCYLLTKVFNKFKSDNGGHPWTLPDCQGAFVNYFNTTFGLNPAWTYAQIQSAYLNCGSARDDGGCAPNIDNLCTPDLSCPSLQYIVQLFHQQYDGVFLPNCVDTFVVFFNNLLGTSYGFPEIQELYLHYCGSLPNVCEPDDIDCQSLLGFLNYFSTLPVPSDITCQENFRQAFNSYFGTSYTDYIQIYNLYKSHCNFILKGCGEPYPPIDCNTITLALNDFMALYPDPPSQLGTACVNTFRAFFNSRFGISTMTGGYTYGQIQDIYKSLCGYNLQVCGNNSIAISQFVTAFNTNYSSLKLPLVARLQLFTFFYNEKFINSQSVNAERGGLQLDAAQALVSDAVLENDYNDPSAHIISDFNNISQALTTAQIFLIKNVPSVQSAYDPQALLGMKQAYYLLHPSGLPANCQDDFTSWFNISMGTQFGFTQLFTIYNNVCGVNAGYICSIPAAALETELRVEEYGTGPQSVSPYQAPQLCGLNEPIFHDYNPIENPCSDIDSIAFNAAEIKWRLYIDSIKNAFDISYFNKCMAAKDMESFTVGNIISEYHYTLYYYDQAGNLVKTVPPAGVQDLHDDTPPNNAFLLNVKTARANNGAPVIPNHTLATEYRYSTLNQVVTQKTPDAGESSFYYDRLGRLSVSQNAKQQTGNKYSYTLYDALGRINEVGQVVQSNPITQVIAQNGGDVNTSGTLANWLNNKPAEQITRTFYDQSYFNGGATLCPDYLCQQNLRNRVSYTAVFAAGTPGVTSAGTHYAATYYDYDIHGNVKNLLQDYNSGVMQSTGNRFKKMSYNYDLISGKVNSVAYQAGQKDAFYHRYNYDAENRLTDAEVSLDNIVWEKMARYFYYKHGPLVSTIYGQQQIQSVTNAYTLQGWMKGVVPGDDPNTQIAKQAFNYGLGYFAGDYKAIGTGITPFAGINQGADLFNGNIKAMLVNVPKIGEPVLHSYKYDQLNRIKEVNNFNNYNTTANTWQPTPAHKETLSFDANGNIQTAMLNGSANNLPYENFTYNYDPVKKNRLLSISNAVDGSTKSYTYNEIGEATKDELEGNANLQWNLYGKLQSVTKMNGPAINYSYDAGSNRISKEWGSKAEYYVRDASGNIMATYRKDPDVNSGRLSTQSYEMYGSSNFGSWNKVRDMELAGANNNILVRGEQRIRLGNHLGNNLLVLTDKKYGIQNPNNPAQIIGYTADVASATDYSAYGENLIGREFNGSGIKYGFNNKLNDAESGYQDYGMRQSSNKRRGFISIDKLTSTYPYYTPYQFAGNMPIAAIDIDGLEQYVVIYYKNQKGGDPYKIEIRAIKSGKILLDQKVQALLVRGGNESDGQKIAKNNVLVFEVYNEGTAREQMKIVDDNRSKLTPEETKTFNTYFKKVGADKDNRFAYLFNDDKSEYQSEEYEGANFYVAEKLFSEKVRPSTKIIRDIPSITVSDGADNGNLVNVGDFSKQLKGSLSSIKKGANVSEIKIDISILTRGGDETTSNMLPYIQKAKAKIEKQIQQSVQATTGVDRNKIKVNVTAANGNSSDSKTTVTIK